MSTETMDLVLVNAQNAVQIFTGGGMAAILDGIEAKVRAIPLDPSTATGREEIRSVAYRVAKTKVALDNEGKKLTEGWREATKKVNEERRIAIERLEALGEDVRRPLTEFENRERHRIAAHEAALLDITGLVEMLKAHPDMSLDLLVDHQRDLAAMLPDYEWEEFAARAGKARTEAAQYLAARIEARKRYEVEQEELARLRKEEAERLQRERDERLKAEAAENARIEAERKAQAEAEAERKRVEAVAAKAKADSYRILQEAREREARIEQDRIREELAKIAAEKRAKAAEDAAIAAKKKADAELAAAKEKAKRDAEAAAAKEREKIERERKAAEEARLKREADEAHRDKIQAEALADLLEAAAWFEPEGGIETGLISCLLGAIMDGEVRHVKVVY